MKLMVKLVSVKKISQLKLNKEKTAAEELEFFNLDYFSTRSVLDITSSYNFWDSWVSESYLITRAGMMSRRVFTLPSGIKNLLSTTTFLCSRMQ